MSLGAADAIPVTVLTGSLGAGKTTLLNHLLRNAGDRKVAVLVNDMGELNVDAELVSEDSDLSVADGTVAELSNGCICCELRDDLETAVVRLARERSFDHLVVEPSGISDPAPVARLFTGGSPAAARYDVDAVVAVVDARQFADTFDVDETRGVSSANRNAKRSGDVDGEGMPTRTVEAGADGERRPLSDLLVEQVEFANLVVLNKCDLVSDAERERVESVVRALRPDTEILTVEYAAAPVDRLLDTGLFDPGTAAERAGWRRMLDADGSGDRDDGVGHDHDDHSDHDHGHGHSHPEEAYGVDSFAYRRRRPFHPARVAALLAALPESVLRAKGSMWVAGREDAHLTYSRAGPSAYAEVTGRWVASLPEFEQEAYRRNRSDLGFEWDEEWGDRRTGLVFIGREMDEEALVASLDDCLLTDAEFSTEWDAFENTFPADPGGRTTLSEPTPGERE
ncbi:GTP-binding protein [Halogeometricum sp. S1BR25-6]|uniref:GTP-binding protein n=1 Tax=Halogeometricum salsisoli TaxID=2950536 RepID=A0ABU2G8N4_9EURY|nr:GTP-binding protein [Halogeometricum sp. S1BR25-6]MDS0297166.1 GTP-binding protein [Halogeometricum sp. S1BR25-6]